MVDRPLDTSRWDNHGELILTGSANAYVATTARQITGYYQGLRICGKANFTNSGAATLNVNGIGAVAIRKDASAALVANDVISGQYYDFLYDATNSWFQLLNPSPGGGFVKKTGDTITVSSGDVTALTIDEGGSSLNNSSAFTVIVPTTGAQKGIQITTPGATAAWISYELNIGGTGKAGFSLGPGSATRDTNLYRDAADTLKTDDSFIVSGTLTIGTVPSFTNIPQNSQSTAYTLVLADAQKHILHPFADNNPRTFTIPSNASVAYPIGTAITFVNFINTLTIAINTDLLVFSSSGASGSRTLAQWGIATAIKIETTTWLISGTGLT
jgi:hypothetical protein